MAEHQVKFATLKLENGRAVETNVRMLKQSDIGKCPQFRFDIEHYNEDGSCKCKKRKR